jgi:FkbM family methyltransferase
VQLRTIVRDALPAGLRIPLRYAYNAWAGQLDAEVALLGTVLPLRRRAVDVGANFGLYAYAMSRKARAVEAFEPVPSCAAFVRRARLRRVRVHQIALSDHHGEGTIHVPVVHDGAISARASLEAPRGPCQAIHVRLATLDSFDFDAVDLVKIDVEGHELSVLHGAVETIERCRPNMIVEIEQRHLRDGLTMADVFAYLCDLGYSGSFLAGGRLRPIREFSYEIHQRPHLDDVDDAAYINNFVFRPLGDRR